MKTRDVLSAWSHFSLALEGVSIRNQITRRQWVGHVLLSRSCLEPEGIGDCRWRDAESMNVREHQPDENPRLSRRVLGCCLELGVVGDCRWREEESVKVSKVYILTLNVREHQHDNSRSCPDVCLAATSSVTLLCCRSWIVSFQYPVEPLTVPVPPTIRLRLENKSSDTKWSKEHCWAACGDRSGL